ncbi:MAG: LytTR family DNA-binding domain-containing protein [Chitinophagaceae bacterium]
MTCIIIDDEPLAREGLRLLVKEVEQLNLLGCFGSAEQADEFLKDNPVDLILLDIQMPGINGLEFAQSLPEQTLVVFTTAYAQYALKSYELDAIDYLVKPVQQERFMQAVNKAVSYHSLLNDRQDKTSIESVSADFMFIKADRRYHKVLFADVLFIEGLKDYVVIHVQDQKMITAMNIKTIQQQLPAAVFVRVSKSYIVNVQHISSFDNHTIYIGKTQIPMGTSYREQFFEQYVRKNLLSRDK